MSRETIIVKGEGENGLCAILDLDLAKPLQQVRAELAEMIGMKGADQFESRGAAVDASQEQKVKLGEITSAEGGKGYKVVSLHRAPIDPNSYIPDDVDVPDPLTPPRHGDAVPPAGYGPGAGTAGLVRVTDLTKDERIELLKLNRIDLKTKLAAAWVMSNDGTLVHAQENAIEFEAARLEPADATRHDYVTVSYTSQEAKWQMQTTGQGTTEGGVPLLFKVKGQYKNVHRASTHSKTSRLYFHASQIIPKARVILDKPKPTKAFVAAVESALKARSAAQLLEVLRKYGQFVAEDMWLGGRIVLESTKDLAESGTHDRALAEFKSAVDARLMIEEVPVDVGGGVSSSELQEFLKEWTAQARSLSSHTVGGDPSVASSKEKILGKHWIPTLGSHKAWQVAGFEQQSLTPTIALLDDELGKSCRDLLRGHFDAQLRPRPTEFLGFDQGTRFEDPIENVKRILAVHLYWGQRMDAIETQYELLNGQTSTVRHGNLGGAFGPRSIGDGGFTLKEGEEIASIEAGVADTLYQLTFWTTEGRRYPTSGSYGGPKKGDRTEVVCAPRVRAFAGHNGTFAERSALVVQPGNVLDSLALLYLDLAADIPHRSFLLALEPELLELI